MFRKSGRFPAWSTIPTRRRIGREHTRTRRPLTLLTVLALLAIFSILIVPTFSQARERQYVVMISVDGLAPFFLNREDVNTPNLDFLANQGVSGTARSVFPSMTWPAHATLVTGSGPGRHGVLGNRYLDSSRRKLIKAWQANREKAIRIPAIYDAAKQAGLRTAGLLWPGTAGAKNLDFNVPELYLRENFRKFVRKSFQRELTENDVPFKLFAELSKQEGFELDFLVRDATVHVITEHRPDLTLTHFVSLDTYSHRRGPRSPRTRWALKLVDTLIGDIIIATQSAGIYNNTTFFIVADHGFLEVKRCIDLNRALSRAGFLRNYKFPNYGREAAAAVYNGHTAYVYFRNPGSAAVRARVKRIIRKIPEVERIYEPKDYAALGLPAPEDDPGVGDLVVLAKPHAFFGNNNRRTVEAADYYKGMHGYLPEHPDMQAGFIITGPQIARGGDQLQIELKDIAPTILSALGILPLESMEGRVLKEIFLPVAPAEK